MRPTHNTPYIGISERSSVDLSKAKHRIIDALVQSVARVERHTGNNPSVYTGLGGIALMHWNMAALNSYSLSFGDQMSAADRHLCSIVNDVLPTSESKSSFLLTSVGPATLILLRNLRYLRDSRSPSPIHHRHPHHHETLFSRATWEDCVAILEKALHLSAQEHGITPPENGCDVLDGRAGLLYSILILREELTRFSSPSSDSLFRAVQFLVSDTRLQALVDDIVRRGEIGAVSYARTLAVGEQAPTLMWPWDGQRYIGAAHGLAGILQILVSCPLHIIERHFARIYPTVDWLILLQDREGNWPAVVPRHATPSRDHSSDTIQGIWTRFPPINNPPSTFISTQHSVCDPREDDPRSYSSGRFGISTWVPAERRGFMPRSTLAHSKTTGRILTFTSPPIQLTLAPAHSQSCLRDILRKQYTWQS
ncbi:hypothetical protein JAAARDRAFT_71314 [Jaapia argillacea MUCL 33604]|uniref:Lanthionine synthetase C family protein n=1 Tax=Jaapia argillacea MUCL 33604 TaxID=933084 RepID=A0A067PNS0_9AGAM|nr:hypothetical protein JAAARDRAFT_71314 [Jaapia argillacea MUCL 33604]